MKYNGLDVYDITINDGDIGIGATSLVSLPAMQSSFLHFNEESPQFMFADEEKRELVGAIMIPDKLIFRKIEDRAFYVNFTEQVIRDLTSKMIKSGTAGLFTIQHEVEVEDGQIDVLEVWVKDSEDDKSVALGIDEPIGTAFMKVKVNNEVVWNSVKESGLTGFSIELDASIVKKNELFNEQKEPETQMKITDVFSNSVEVNGTVLYFNSELAEKAYLVEDAEGKPAPYSGEFTHADVKYTVDNGVVTEAVNIQLSVEESIKKLSDAFSAVNERIDGILATEKAIEEKEAELELLKSQFEKEKEDFAKLKESNPDSKVELRLSANIAENGSVGREWLSKF